MTMFMTMFMTIFMTIFMTMFMTMFMAMFMTMFMTMFMAVCWQGLRTANAPCPAPDGNRACHPITGIARCHLV